MTGPGGEADRSPGRALRLWSALTGPFWVLPLAITVASVVAGILLPLLDDRLTHDTTVFFGGGASAARTLLSTIATAMISVTGLVFSITIVVLQLASTQFTPRALQGFLQQRLTQATLGVFVATFTFALIVLRSVRSSSSSQDEFVPQVSVSVAFLLVMASIATFLAFIQWITRSIQMTQVIFQIADGTRDELVSLFGDPDSEDGQRLPEASAHADPEPRTRTATLAIPGRHGVVEFIALTDLVHRLAALDGWIDVTVDMGRFVADGQPLALVHADRELDPSEVASLRSAFSLGRQRTMRQDPGFGFRQLVDIAERGLSPGVNDPTTALQCVDHLHTLLRLVVRRPALSPTLLDDDGKVRVRHRPPRLADLLDVAVDEIVHYGGDLPRARHRVLGMLEDLFDAALPEHRQVIAAKRDSVARQRVEG